MSGVSTQPSYAWRSFARTDPGHVREANEDAYLERCDIGLWVVADGMGGHSAGDVASETIVTQLSRLDPPQSLSGFVSAVENCLLDVNDTLRKMAGQAETGTIGSTVATLLAMACHCVCVWAGDSRVYRCRDGQLEMLTRDHALLEDLVDRGLLTRQDAARHPHSHLITRAVGAADSLCLDMEIYELRHGDRFLLCSDGLDKEVEDDEIGHVMCTEPVSSICTELMAMALTRGARDNITLVAVEVFDPSQPDTESADETAAMAN